MKKPLCIAHRGASAHAPENTLLAFQKAVELGADWIELDVFCVENELVVIHDERLERTTTGIGYVLDKSLAEIRELDAGNGQQIPLLTEVFDLIERNNSGNMVGLNIELKGTHTAEPAVRLIQQRLANEKWTYDRLIISSFNHHELKTVKARDPLVKIAPLIACLPLNYAQVGTQLSAYSIHSQYEFTNKDFVDDAHQRGIQVYVYTVNHQTDLEKMIDICVDGIITDDPSLVINLGK